MYYGNRIYACISTCLPFAADDLYGVRRQEHHSSRAQCIFVLHEPACFGKQFTNLGHAVQVDPSHVSYAHHGVQGNREKPNIWPMSARRKTTLNEVSCRLLP